MTPDEVPSRPQSEKWVESTPHCPDPRRTVKFLPYTETPASSRLFSKGSGESTLFTQVRQGGGPHKNGGRGEGDREGDVTNVPNHPHHEVLGDPVRRTSSRCDL